MANERQALRNTQEEPYLSSYLHRKGVALGLPIGGNFELTARCNFNCRMCYVHQNGPELAEKEITAEQWLSLAREAKEQGMMFLLLTGGEPLLRQDFPYLYTELIKMGLLVSINTNASLYNEELRELFLRYPPSRLNVTLYGGSEETYRDLCGNPSYQRVTDNLRSMKADGLQVRLNVSLTPYNVADMEKIEAFSRELNLQLKAASYMYPPVRRGGESGENAGRFTAECAGEVIARWNALRDGPEKMLARAESLRRCASAGIVENCDEVAAEGVRCRAGRSSFWVTWDGRMLPCGMMDIEASYPFEVGFKTAWDEVRARTAAIRLPLECASCPDRVNCMVCAASAKAETGAFDRKPEYVCRMIRSAKEETIKIADQISGGKTK